MSVLLILCAIVYMVAFFIGSIVRFSDSSMLLSLVSIRGFMFPKLSPLFLFPILAGVLMIVAVVCKKRAAQIITGALVSLAILLILLVVNTLGTHLMHLVRLLFEYLIPAEYKHLEQQIQISSGGGLVCMLISSIVYTLLAVCNREYASFSNTGERHKDTEEDSIGYDEF